MLTGEFLGVSEDVSKIVTNVGTLLSRVPQYIGTAAQVMEDPALPALAERIRLLRQIEEARKLEEGRNEGVPPKPVVGVGLEKVIKPLDALIYVRRKPWVPYVLAGAIVAVPLAVGFGVGRLSRRRR